MSFLDPVHETHGAIIEALAVYPGLEMQPMHHKLVSEYDIEISVSNLYRTVAQLVEKQVLVKDKGRLSLNQVWVSHMLRFAATIEAKYIGSGKLDVLELPQSDGQRMEFKADSLAGLDPVWNHVLAKISSLSKKEAIWYEYDSHAWYPLGMHETEMNLYEQLGEYGNKLYGNDTFLDRYGAKLGRTITPVINDAPPFPKEGYSLWVCGDYTVDCVFPDSISRHFAFFFQTVKSIEQFDTEFFSDIFKMKARCSITVLKSEASARDLREKMKPYFTKQMRK